MKKIVLLLFLIACSNSHKNLQGKYDNTIAIPETSMVKILRDYHLSEGVNAVKNMKELMATNEKDTIHFLDSIIISNGYDRKRFDTTLKIYIKDLPYFAYVYDNVIKDLSKLEGENNPKVQK